MYIFVIIYDNKYIKIIKVTIFLVGVKGLTHNETDQDVEVQPVKHIEPEPEKKKKRNFCCLIYTVEDFNPHSG
jgi:hypothetical protein